MATREEIMAGYGVLSCPEWCARSGDPDDGEQCHEEHLGEWHEAVNTTADPAGGLVVRARARRGWFFPDVHNVETDCTAEVEVQILGERTPPRYLPAGAIAVLKLTPEDALDLAGTLNELSELAEGEQGEKWVWAFPGAEDLAAAGQQEQQQEGAA